jgi:hypothetical protein
LFRALRTALAAGKHASGEDARALAAGIVADLAGHWGLDRKLREAFTGLGASGDEAWRVTEIIKAVLARTGAAGKAADGKQSATASRSAISGSEGGAKKQATVSGDDPNAETLALENYDADDFRSILKVNYFEDAFWFNKEAFEDALFYTPLFSLLETGEGKAETIAAVKEQFRKAEAASGYKLDALVEALTAKPKKAAAKGRAERRQ